MNLLSCSKDADRHPMCQQQEAAAMRILREITMYLEILLTMNKSVNNLGSGMLLSNDNK